ncbi:hypothetical protein CSV77_04930 [Sporosarcina sp. P16b]|uniref:hypothetical protein n=1 Tax=Sporosarcina sp. P16b TaxID=2048261 RepID=UPI000C170CFC|nr:hypothetical protein [Sporosarcina sp. P16b]PIC71376.1 hypothetical protein CSV77_04930 [Sporosarcina sp. P16b]
MAQCNYCNKKGIFLRVSEMGLCPNCDGPVKLCINRHIEIIQESAELVDNSKVFNTRLGRVDTIVNNLNILAEEYVSKGINIPLDIDSFKNKISVIKSQIIEAEAYNKTDDFLRKAGLAKTLNTKINNANKALLFLKELQNDFGYMNEELGIKVMRYIHDAEYQDLLLKAEKEEFKENYKKAIDKYKDVLFFLAKDDIDDNLQRDIIQNIQNKIDTLSTNLKK